MLSKKHAVFTNEWMCTRICKCVIPFKDFAAWGACMRVRLQVTARFKMMAAHTPAIGGLHSSNSTAWFVLHVMSLSGGVRYVSTCFNSLAQSAAASASVEASFQYTQSKNVERSTAAPAQPSVAGPPRGDYAKVWLHPDDVSLLYPQPPEVKVSPSHASRGSALCAVGSQTAMFYCKAASLSLPNTSFPTLLPDLRMPGDVCALSLCRTCGRQWVYHTASRPRCVPPT